MTKTSELSELRRRLRDAGYAPTPVAGKVPVLDAWQEKLEPNDGEIDSWPKNPNTKRARSTGLIAKRTPSLDVDIMNEAAAEAIEQLVRERFSGRGRVLVRIGQPPKRLIPFRTAAPFKKIATKFVGGDKLEFLGDGQQFVAFGVHPVTHKRYQWSGGEPGGVAASDLPTITEAEARALVGDAAALLTERFGYTLTNGRDEAGGNDNPFSQYGYQDRRADWRDLIGSILNETDLHDSTVKLAASLVAARTDPGAVVRIVQGLMEQTPEGERNERWRARYDDIQRTVESARKKFTESSKERSGSVIVRASDVTMEQIDWLWPRHLARGYLHLLTGLPDRGKSQCQCAMIAAVTTTGKPWPDGAPGPKTPMSVIMLTAEDNVQQVLLPRLVAAGARTPDRVFIFKYIRRDGKNRQFLLSEDLEQLRRDVEKITEQHGEVGLITIDPITAYMGGKLDSHKATEVRSQLGPLKDFAEEVKIAISAVTHPAKSAASQKALDQFIGSQAFIAAARLADLCIDEVDENETPTGRVLYTNVRVAIGRRAPTLAYRIREEVVVDPKSMLQVVTSLAAFEDGAVEITADEAIASGKKRESAKIADAIAFLGVMLADGPRLQKEIEEEAKARSIKLRTLQRAKDQVCEKSEKEGNVVQGPWMWKLKPGVVVKKYD